MRWSPQRRRAGAKVLIVGMKLPPNYGPRVRARVRRAVRRRGEGAQGARSCPTCSRASARTSRSSSPTASIRRRKRSRGCSTTVWPALKPLLGAGCQMTHADVSVPRHRVGIAALSRFADVIDVRTPDGVRRRSRPGRDQLSGARRTTSAPQVGTLHAQASGFEAKKRRRGADRPQHRGHRRALAATSRATGRRSSIAGAAASAAGRSRTC